MKTLTELVADALVAVKAVADNAPAIEIVSESVLPGVTLGNYGIVTARLNSVEIRKTLARKSRCDMPPGLVQIDNDIRIASGNQIRGLGTSDNPSVIQVVPGSPAVAARGPAKAWYSLFQSNTAAGPLVGDTFGLPVGPAHGVSISNLMLDCGFDEQSRDAQGRMLTTTQAISIEGTGIVAEDVVIRNCGKGLGGGECFAVRMFAPSGAAAEPRSSWLSRIRCSHIGSAVQTHAGAGGDEITLFSLVGSPANLLVAPVIENCVVANLKRGPSQPSPIHVFHTAYCVGDVVRNNTVLDSDATCVYRDTGRSRASRVTDNLFMGVHRGVFLNAVTDFWSQDFSIDGNRIELYADKPSWIISGTPAGILLQSTGGPSFVRGQFAGNVIRGMGGDFGAQHFYSRGIYLELRSKTDAAGLVARDNLIDVLQPPVGPYYNFPMGVGMIAKLGLYVANLTAWDVANPCLRSWGNRDSSGVLLPITITDAGYIPRLSVSQV